MEVKQSACQFCHFKCGILAYVENGRIVKYEGDPNYPINMGALCSLAKDGQLTEWLYHPDQLMYPLKRVGLRGEGKWQRIAWDQALDEIAQKLQELKEKYGPESVAIVWGTARTIGDTIRQRFANLFGTPTRSGAGVHCRYVAWHVDCCQIGWDSAGGVHPGLTRCAIMWGSHLSHSREFAWSYFRAAKKKGLKLIVIDPRFTEEAAEADLWLQIRPGSDLALALAMVNVVVKESLYDKGFVEEWTNAQFLIREDNGKFLKESDVRKGDPNNFMVWDPKNREARPYISATRKYEPADLKPMLEGYCNVTLLDGTSVKCKTVWQAIRERVEDYSPEKVEELTWVPREKIIEAARMYALNRPGTIVWGVSTDQTGKNVAYLEFTKNILRGIVGNIDIPGGDAIIGPPPKVLTEAEVELNDLFPVGQRIKKLGSDQFRLSSWAAWEYTEPYLRKYWDHKEALSTHQRIDAPWPLVIRATLTGKPYPINAWLIQSANVLVKNPNTKLIWKALMSESLELVVVHDYFMTPTAAFADYVLPAASTLETDYMDVGQWNMINHMLCSERAVEPLGERKSDLYFWRELGIRLGQNEYWPFKTDEELFDLMLKPLNTTFREIIDSKKRGIIPPSMFEKHKEIDPVTNRIRGFATPTGKIELASTVLDKLGYDPLPYYVEPKESPYSTPTLAKTYPLILTTGGRVKWFYHSEQRQLRSSRQKYPYPLLDIHPYTAQDLGIKSGDWVYVETRTGSARLVANVTPGIDPRVVHAPHSWWYPEFPLEFPHIGRVLESNINNVIPDDPEYCDDLYGSYPYRAVLCKVYKAKDYTT